MNINIAEYTEVMEQQLKAARLDLLEDARLTIGANAEAADDLDGLGRLIREKMEAAARYGYAAIESSLRPAAQDRLLSSGVTIEKCRQQLDAAAARLQPGTAPPRTLAPPAQANIVAGIVMAAAAVVSIGLYLIYHFPPLLLMLLVAVAIVPAAITRRMLLSGNAAARDRFLSEYPGELCRHYVEETASRLEEYRQALANAPAEEQESSLSK